MPAQALKASLVDECQLFVWPTILGGGKPALMTDARADLELLGKDRPSARFFARLLGLRIGTEPESWFAAEGSVKRVRTMVRR